MITSVISSAARLSLAPVRLAARVGGSLLRELRGDGPAAAQPASSPARAKPATRRSASARPKRKATPARAKAQRKRAAAPTRAQAQPKRAPRRKPLDDVTIARKVESIIFRNFEVDKGSVDVNVAEGVLWLRGEVRTPDLINELEARAARVTEVRRVENLLHLPSAPAPGRTDTPVSEREDRAVVRGETSEGTPTPAAALRASYPAAADESSEREDPEVDAPDKETKPYQPSDPGLRDLTGG
jgi:osmotically-inducible protein OsmY